MNWLEGIIRSEISKEIIKSRDSLPKQLEEASTRTIHAYYNSIKEKVLKAVEKELDDAVRDAIEKTKTELILSDLNFQISGNISTLKRG